MSLEDTEHWDLTVRRGVSKLFLLSALAEQPMHGYELANEIAIRSGECCAPSDAAIYPTLRELSEGGYITCEAASTGKRQRNVCTLTDSGREVLATAAASWGRVLPHLQKVIDDAPQVREPITFIESKEAVR
jgi:PadR family transcriptional regulator PadR